MKHTNSEKHWNKTSRVAAGVLAVIMLLAGCGVKDVKGNTVSQTTTSAGDIVLYSGNQMVIFYGSNSWAYTRLGRITDKSAREMADLLGNGNVTVTMGEFE